MKKLNSVKLMLIFWVLITGTVAYAAQAPAVDLTRTYPQPHFTQDEECEIGELPYSQGFENTGTSLPACWHHIQVGNSTATIDASQPHSGSYSLKISGKQNDNGIVVSPELTFSNIGTTKISFYIKRGSNDIKLEVGVMTDPNDVATFNPFHTVENVTANWEKYSFYLYGQEGQYIAFRIKDQNNYSPSELFIDDIYWEEAEPCPDPRNFSVNNITSFSALVKWEDSPTSNLNMYELEMKQDGEADWSPVVITGENTQDLTGLNASTVYYARLRANCNENGYSEWDTISFRTLCTEYFSTDIVDNFTVSRFTGDLPSQLASNYSYSQQIYEKIHLQDIEGEINALSFQYGENVLDAERDIILYLGHTDNVAFADNTSWVPFANLQEVYRGKVLYTNSQNRWPTIYFDSSFTYDPEKNLVIAYVDNTGFTPPNYSSGRFQVDTLDHNVTLRITSPSTPYDIESFTSGGRLSNVRNNIRLSTCGTTECVAPLVEIPSRNGEITDETVDVTLIPSNYGSQWEVEYKVDTATNWTSFGSITETDFKIEGLTSSTNYMLRVRTICTEEDTSAWSQSFTFTTSCGMIKDDTFSEDFNASTELPECWKLIHNLSGPYTPKVAIGEGVNSSNGIKLYSSGSQYCYIVLPEMNISNMPQEFIFECQLKSVLGKLVIGNMTDPTDISTFEGTDTIDVTSNAWNLHQIVYSLPANGNTYLVLQWVSNGEQGYVDNIALKPLFCLAPTKIKTVERTTGSATITWTELHEATSWNVKYGEFGFDTENADEYTLIDNTTKPCLLSSLTDGTAYQVYVQSKCGDEDLSEWAGPYTFTTLCTSVPVPYAENFDDNNTLIQNFPGCWSRPVTYTTGNLVYPMIDTQNPTSSPNSLKFASMKDFPVFAVTPQIQNTISDYEIIFYLRQDSPNAGSMDIGVMTSPDDTSSFQLVETIVPENSDWKRYTVSLEEIEGNDLFIAFRHHSERSNKYFYLDNVKVAPIGTTPLATYDITITAGRGGTVLPGDTTVEEGTYLPITFSADQGYKVDRIKLDGNNVQRNGLTYIIPNIQAEHSFEVEFAELCNTPTGIRFYDATDTSVIVTWNANSNADQWQIEYRVATETEWQTMDCGQNCGLSRDTISGLTPGTTYELRLRLHCVEGWSFWSEPESFTTNTSPCTIPSDITVEVFTDSAFVSWTAGENTEGWQLEYQAEGEANWTVVNCGEDCALTEKGLSGLEPSTTYKVRVRNSCGDDYSNWSVEKSFTTDEIIGITKYAWEGNITIYPNPVNDYVNIEIRDLNIETLSLYDIYGKLIRTEPVLNQHIKIDLHPLPSGFYFIRLANQEGSYTQKLIKR